MEYKNKFEDFFYESTASTLDYTIMTGGQVIFQGRAIKSPSQSKLRINVAQRVRDWLENEMPDFRGYDGVVIPHPNALMDFDVCDLYGNVYETYKVLLDYTEDFTGADMILSEPVNGHTDPRQKIFWSSFNTTERDILVDYGVEFEIIFDADFPLVIPPTGGTFNIHYTANTDFTFSYESDWFTAELSGDTIIITAGRNQSSETLHGSVCFAYLGLDFEQHTKCYDVIQEFAYPLTFDIISGGTIVHTAPNLRENLKYSFDSGETWNTLETVVSGGKKTGSINVSAGQSVMFRRDAEDSGTFSGSTAVFNAKYDVTSIRGFYRNLIAYRLFEGTKVVDASELIMPERVVAKSDGAMEGGGGRMFKDCKMLVNAPELPATEAYINEPSEDGYSTYYAMFSGCTSLVNAPSVLPLVSAETGAYRDMFAGCTSLETAPEIKAKSARYASFKGMFAYCSSLVNAPEILVESMSYTNCFERMFFMCTSLVNAPSTLPSTELQNYCYVQMFQGCASLETAPELPATSLTYSCYADMFWGCTSLETAPELPATSLAVSCYHGMFHNCTSLVNATELPATSLTSSCYYGMFSGCTSLVDAPELPATNLANSCYAYMFNGCTSLETAPDLLADTPITRCYAYMFSGCTSLSSVKCLASISEIEYTNGWMLKVPSRGTFYRKSGVSWVAGTSGIIRTWTIVNV